MKIGDIETDNLTDEQLRELALGTAVPPTPETPQHRDEAGRFVSNPRTEETVTEETIQEDEPTEEEVEAPTVYRRVIDLGDGSGVQVFEASTPEGLIDKLADAQYHATKKIRDMNKAQKEAAPVMSANDRYVLQQRLISEPDVVLREAVKQTLESDPNYQEIQRQKLIADSTRVFEEWQASKPEFHFTPSNGKKMGDIIRMYHNGIATRENVEQAYQSLKSDGLLQEKPAETPAPVTQPTQIVRRSSGLSARRSSPPPPATPPTNEDAYNMPIEKLRELANGGKSYGGW